MSRPTSKQKKLHDEIRELGCIVCQNQGIFSPACIHHVRAGLGMAQRDHDKVIPLCYEHHQGQNGIHLDKKAFEEKYGTELDLLAQVERWLSYG